MLRRWAARTALSSTLLRARRSAGGCSLGGGRDAGAATANAAAPPAAGRPGLAAAAPREERLDGHPRRRVGVQRRDGAPPCPPPTSTRWPRARGDESCWRTAAREWPPVGKMSSVSRVESR